MDRQPALQVPAPGRRCHSGRSASTGSTRQHCHRFAGRAHSRREIDRPPPNLRSEATPVRQSAAGNRGGADVGQARQAVRGHEQVCTDHTPGPFERLPNHQAEAMADIQGAEALSGAPIPWPPVGPKPLENGRQRRRFGCGQLRLQLPWPPGPSRSVDAMAWDRARSRIRWNAATTPAREEVRAVRRSASRQSRVPLALPCANARPGRPVPHGRAATSTCHAPPRKAPMRSGLPSRPTSGRPRAQFDSGGGH